MEADCKKCRDIGDLIHFLMKERNDSKFMTNLTKITTLMSLKTDTFQQLHLPSPV